MKPGCIIRFWNDEHGEDLIEYTLIAAFLALASAALFVGANGGISRTWCSINSQLDAACAAAHPTTVSP
jgi:Flp pilus assembly pilin Flp